jgi:hypothetical protein
MSYGFGKERENWAKRAVPLAVGKLSQEKRNRLFVLREAILSLMRKMAIEAFIQEPLAEPSAPEAQHKRLLAMQREAGDGTFNSVWREQARVLVKPAMEACYDRYFRRLSGALRHIDARIPAAEAAVYHNRIYYHIPEGIDHELSRSELRKLKALGKSSAAIATLRRVIINGDTGTFTKNELAVLRFIHAQAQEKHRPPDFGGKGDFTLQLHLNTKMLPTRQRRAADNLLRDAALILLDENNRCYTHFLDISGIAPMGPRIRIPVQLPRAVAKRINGANGAWSSLILELSETRIQARMVVGMPPLLPEHEAKKKTHVPIWTPKPVIHSQAFVGRDFGYKNTVSLSVAVVREPVDIIPIREMLEEMGELEDPREIRGFLQSRPLGHDSVEIVERLRYSGENFLDKVAGYARRIDVYQSRITKAYQKLEGIKAEMVQGLGLGTDDLITPEMKRGPMAASARAFFATMGLIYDLKKVRKQMYEKIVAVKRHWFGFLANQETRLAQKYSASVVREDLRVEAIEKGTPEYKGRAFNKMINHGSKGQYQRRASQNLRWNGVPEVVVPSWYTSRSCVWHAVILPQKFRRGERIELPCCGREDHADEHAADTIACYPLLVAQALWPPPAPLADLFL